MRNPRGPQHSPFEDLVFIDADFTRKVESRFPGRDFNTAGDQQIHRQGTSSIRYGRGAVLTLDLTNRCNFLAACAYAKKLGYMMVQAATNGIRFALEPSSPSGRRKPASTWPVDLPLAF